MVSKICYSYVIFANLLYNLVMAFNRTLKILRIERGLYQKDLAKLIGVESYNISNWEQGRTEPCLDDLRKLCTALKVSADELLEINTYEKNINVININNKIK